MANEYFKIDSPETYNEVYDTWMRVTAKESQGLNVPKKRLFVSLETIDIFQDGLQSLVENNNLSAAKKRKIMQLGYSLEEIKLKLKKAKD
jgi:hypothetical protein